MPDDLAAALEEIRARQALASDASLGFSRMQERHDTLIRVAYEDTPRLLAAVQRVLELADEAGPWGWKPGEGGIRIPVRWDLDPAKVREAITAALTGVKDGTDEKRHRDGR